MASILFVDDDDDFAFAISRLLESAGYDVRLAANGEEALEAAREESPDLVLLDLLMPIKSGFDTCHELKAIEGMAGVPVLGLTAFGRNIGETHEANSQQGLGLDDCLEKPVEPNVLLERIAAALA